ncbi:MAG: phytanoyl-CoA dioxygenase family protein [Planctomycetes bacterium]|nr:phytanoyl-CoA dioxygenase family protein [Planctomycetota bacterium]
MVSPHDLRAHHAPLTAAFPREQTGYELTTEQRARFERDGFLDDLPLLTHPQVEELRHRLDRIGHDLRELEPRLDEIEAAWLDRPSEVVLHFLGAWAVDPWFHDLIFHPGATSRCVQLLQVDRLRFFHDQVFWKPANHPGVVPWHQDYAYWQRTAPAAHLTVFLALDDLDLDNGTLHYVPGSHRWPLSNPIPFDAEQDALAAQLDETRRQALRHAVPVRMRAGHVSIHHSHMVHGSGPNHADRPRRAVVVLNYMASTTCVADDSSPVLRGVHLPRGALVEGRNFPIVWPLAGDEAPVSDMA